MEHGWVRIERVGCLDDDVSAGIAAHRRLLGLSDSQVGSRGDGGGRVLRCVGTNDVSELNGDDVERAGIVLNVEEAGRRLGGGAIAACDATRRAAQPIT